MAGHPQFEGFQPLQQEPGIHGTERGAGMAQEGLQLFFDIAAAAQHHAAQGPALAIDMLGGGIDDDIGAMLEGPLQ